MSDSPAAPQSHRFDDNFKRRAHELYNELRESRFELALQTLRITLNDLLKAKFDPTEKLRLRVEEGRIKGLNRLLVKASAPKYKRKIKKPEDICQAKVEMSGC